MVGTSDKPLFYWNNFNYKWKFQDKRKKKQTYKSMYCEIKRKKTVLQLSLMS